MTEWKPDPQRHRPEGMDMAGRVEGVQPELPELGEDIERLEIVLTWVPEPHRGEARKSLSRIKDRLRRRA